MEENTNLGMEELSADQHDDFLEGWGDESPETEEAADQQTEQEEGQAQEAEAATRSPTLVLPMRARGPPGDCSTGGRGRARP